jgi:hypothetical protein
MYEQADGIGEIRRSIFLPDRVTGQPRQVDVALFIEAKGHPLVILIDAKFYKEKLDVKDIEGVLALADAVGANKSVIVAANGWTEPAARRAEFAGLDLLLLNVDEALELMVEDKWQLCPACEADCIVLEHSGALIIEGAYSIFLAGQCRECRLGFVWCWSCGAEGHIEPGQTQECGCGHSWRVVDGGVCVRPHGSDEELSLAELPLLADVKNG